MVLTRLQQASLSTKQLYPANQYFYYDSHYSTYCCLSEITSSLGSKAPVQIIHRLLKWEILCSNHIKTLTVCSPQSVVSWLSINRTWNSSQPTELSSFGAGSVTWMSPLSQGCHTPVQGQPGMSHSQWCTGRGKRLSRALQAHCDQPWDQGEVLVIPSLRQHKSSLQCGIGVEFHSWCVSAALK